MKVASCAPAPVVVEEHHLKKHNSHNSQNSQNSAHNRTGSFGTESGSSASFASQNESGEVPPPPAPIASESTAPKTYRQDLGDEIPEGRLTETQIALSNCLTVDKYGFIKGPPSNGHGSSPQGLVHKRTPSIDQQVGRTRKWVKMLGNQGSQYKAYSARKPEKVKRRVRKGIPDQLRGLAWLHISGGHDLMVSHPGLYQALLDSQEGGLEMEIIRDLGRTFPNHVLFHDRQGPGQHYLYHVLRAYSIYDKQVGYVQGMGFIAAILLIYMAEEEAFWTLAALMKGTTITPIEAMFVPGMPLLQQYMFQFEQLLADEAPRLAGHFTDLGVDPSMFCTHWFTTVFAYMMPFEHLLRVWDVFVLEGMKVVFRVGLALMVGAQPQLLQMNFDKLVGALNSKQYPDFLKPPDQLMRTALGFSVSRRLEEIRKRYRTPTNSDHGA